MTFADLKPGQRARIVGFNPGDASYRRSLLTMGLTPGAEFILARFAPLGDPVEILLSGFSLMLRKAEAKLIRLEIQPAA